MSSEYWSVVNTEKWSLGEMSVYGWVVSIGEESVIGSETRGSLKLVNIGR